MHSIAIPLVLLLLLLHTVLLKSVLSSTAEDFSLRECNIKSFGYDSFVCQCDASYGCDNIAPIGNIEKDQAVVYTTSMHQHRLNRTVMKFEKYEPSNSSFTLKVNSTAQLQKIIGFGGAITDAATSVYLKDNALKKVLLRQYYGPDGIEYSIGRVPIGSCDFSEGNWSYSETPDDYMLEHFGTDQDYKLTRTATRNSSSDSRNQVVWFIMVSSWLDEGHWKDARGGKLKGGFNGVYYLAYAKYLLKFFKLYATQGINFWGMTIQNEPSFGSDYNWRWQGMYLSPAMQRDFVNGRLAPLLKSNNLTKDIIIMAHDDQRSEILGAAKDIYSKKVNHEVDGLGVHWYSWSAYEPLSEVHKLRPDKFILSTEACNSYYDTDHIPQLGSWQPAQNYAHDIIQNLRNYVAGWTDWNIWLNEQGGPNWVGNFVDAPIIVDTEKGVFYKQPMYYILGHFSKFIPPGSYRVNSTQSKSDNGFETVSFITPKQQVVVVVMNTSGKRKFDIVVKKTNSTPKMPKQKVLRREHLMPLFSDNFDNVGQPIPATPRERVMDRHWEPIQEQLAIIETLKEKNTVLRHLGRWPSKNVTVDMGAAARDKDTDLQDQVEVTDMFFKACRSLKFNETLYGDDFEVPLAMNAAELMGKTTDCGLERIEPFFLTEDKVNFIKKCKWADIDYITICDTQLALMASWLVNVESLDTTVFTNVLSLHPETCDNDIMLKAIINSCNWIVSMFINLVESAETIVEDDAMNRKTVHQFCSPNYVDVMAFLDEAIEQNNLENSFNKDLYIATDGELKPSRPSIRTLKEAIAVRLEFLKSLMEAIGNAFPLLTRSPEGVETKNDRKNKKLKKPKKRKPSDPELPNLRNMTKCFRLAYSYISLSLDTVEFGRPPPDGFDYEHINRIRNMGNVTKDRTLFNEEQSGVYAKNPDGDYSWVPPIVPNLSFHQLPNNFPHEVKLVSRDRGLYFFGSFIQELYDAILMIPPVPWALDEVFGAFAKFQKLHVVARSFLELTILTSKLKILWYYNLEDLTENGIDDFSCTYKLKQLFYLATMQSLFFQDPLPHFNLDEPEWPVMEPDELIKLSPFASGLTEREAEDRQSELNRFSYASTLKQFLYDMGRVHSHHLQYLVHSTYHFRSKMCTNLADLYASYLPKALTLELTMDRSMTSYNRKVFQDHIELVRKTGIQRPLPLRFSGCPAFLSTYVQYHTFMLCRMHIQQTLHLEIVPMGELDMVLFIYLCVLRRFGSILKKQMMGYNSFTKLPIPDTFDRIVEERQILEARAQATTFPNMVQVAAEVQMCLVNVREEYDLWNFTPSYQDYKIFLNFMTQDYLNDRPPCKSTEELCTYANINFLRAKELYMHTEKSKHYVKELGAINSFLQRLSEGQYKTKNAFKLTFPYLDNIMIFDIRFPGTAEIQSPRITSPTLNPSRTERKKVQDDDVDKLAQDLQHVQVAGDKQKKKKGKK
ncbi:unnamed protein product [Bursaphelenchus okinawaensis]|uniref:Glucosylceramidase n=1 Tax=Bursaphelenchus okinawaensis TaxID=465554 RepID=A0A811LBU3_9BILA|nr:unnamed protein product [Bursaphelenchus okinawaensis]CAG9121124.1 unnamed protein product [Bursaphelenchus okinawaensis]